jgi:hypothetical protein
MCMLAEVLVGTSCHAAQPDESAHGAGELEWFLRHGIINCSVGWMFVTGMKIV